MQGVKVLLSRLEGPVNLGFIARAMANTGFSDLAYTGIVSPDDEDARKFAVHASEILETANRHESFSQLISECDVVIGFSPRDPFSNNTLPFEQLKDYVTNSLSKGMSIGLLFGNEASGLDNNELSSCSKRVSLPTNSGYISMNLAQAVLVALWEIKDCKAEPSPEKDIADRKTKNTLLNRIREHLELIEYFNEQNPDNIWQELTQIIEGQNLTSREAELLISIFAKSTSRYKHLQKNLKK